MSVGGSTSCCGSLPARDVSAQGQSPQQVAPDQVEGGGGAVATQCCYVAPAGDPAAVQGSRQPAGSDSQAPAGAVDPNTGQPLNGSAVAGESGPPAPIAAPEGAGAPAANPTPGTDGNGNGATNGSVAPTAVPEGSTPTASGSQPIAYGPATSLPTWPQWTQAFTDLGIDAANIQRIGGQQLTDQQLALVYMTIKRELEAQRANPSAPGTGPGTAVGGWSPQWEQKFLSLGLPASDVTRIRDAALAQRADDTRLQALFDQVAAGLQQQQGATPGGVDPNAPAWNAQVEQAFTDLGMPKEYIEAYRSMGSNAAGVQAAYAHAAERVEAFRKLGYYDKLKGAGLSDLQIWQHYVLADKPPTTDELAGVVQAQTWAKAPLWKKGAQAAITFFPGGELVQYVLGRKIVSGSEIDRTNPMNIGFAALSGLAAFMAVRGWMNIRGGWKAVNSGLPELAKAGGVQAIDDAVLGSLKSGGLGTRIMSYVPFTSQHSAVVGFAHAESAAKAFNNGAAQTLLKSGTDGALQVATLQQMFNDLATGQMVMSGGKNAYLGAIGLPFKAMKAPPIQLFEGPAAQTAQGIIKAPDQLIAAKNLSTSRPDQILAGMLEAGGQKLGANPSWLQTSPSFVDNVTAIGRMDRTGIGKVMAGNAAQALGATAHGTGPLESIFGRIKPGPASYFSKLASGSRDVGWYQQLAAGTAAEFTGVAGMGLRSAAAGAGAGGGAATISGLGALGGAAAASGGGHIASQLADEAATGASQFVDDAAGAAGRTSQTLAQTAAQTPQKLSELEGAVKQIVDRADDSFVRADGSLIALFRDGSQVEISATGDLIRIAADGSKTRMSAHFLFGRSAEVQGALLPRFGQLKLPLKFA